MAMYNEITVTAELTNTEYMITKNYNLLENKPQINSVELIGNKSLEDLGINPDAEENVIDVVKVNGSALTPDADKAVNVTVTTGSDNGTVKVNGSDVAVKGLKSAAFTEATAYDAAGSAAEVHGEVEALTVVVNGKVDKVQGKGLSQNDFTNAYKSKLDGIEAGAQVNTVTSVAGKTGAVTLQKSDVGLGNVDNTSDLNKPISTATQTALNGKVDKEAGKGLSQNDFTNELKSKLDGIESGAEVNVQADWNQTDSSADDYIKNKPSLVGEVPNLISGGSLSLVTPEITQNAPYIFRQTAGGLNNLFPLMNLKSIVGGSVVWNQLFNVVGTIVSARGTTVKSGNKVTFTTTTASKYQYFGQDIALKKDHKYLYSFDITISENTIISVGDGTTQIANREVNANTKTHISFTYEINNDRTAFYLYPGYGLTNGLEVGSTAELENAMVIDLTATFNTAIANYINTLETAEAGSGIAWLKKYGFFTKDYYAYSPNTIQSVNVSAHNTVGFNAYDNSTGKAKLVGGKEYQITGTYTALSYSTGETLTPDSNGKFTPSASGELTVTGGDNTTCVHLVWDGERDGEYEAYSEHIYPLDSDLELRGIPKLDANNNLYYDGDTYESDGTVTRKYGFRAYQSGDESLADAITDGTNTVYKLTTPTTETATPFQALQIVDDFGTEEFVDTRDVPIPVGNESVYRQEIELPALPTTDGNYNLQFTKSASGVTTSFVSTS